MSKDTIHKQIEEALKEFDDVIKIKTDLIHTDGDSFLLEENKKDIETIKYFFGEKLSLIATKSAENDIAFQILRRFYYEDWEVGQTSDVGVGDFVDLFFEVEMNGYHEWHIQGVIVLDKYSDYGKDLPIILLNNGESVVPQKAWESASISRIKPTKKLIDELVKQSSFNDYPEYEALSQKEEQQ